MGSLELELSTGLKSRPERNLVYESIQSLQITSIQTFHNLKQKWIGVTLKGRDGQYSCGSTLGLSNTYSVQPGERFVGIQGFRGGKCGLGAIHGAQVIIATKCGVK